LKGAYLEVGAYSRIYGTVVSMALGIYGVKSGKN